MDGNPAKEEMFKIFNKPTNAPDGAMTFQEQKALAMWVRSPIIFNWPLAMASSLERRSPSQNKRETDHLTAFLSTRVGHEFSQDMAAKGLDQAMQTHFWQTSGGRHCRWFCALET